MGRHSTHQTAMDVECEDIKVEIVCVEDTSTNADATSERVANLIAKIILLGKKKRKPRMEVTDEKKIAA